MELTAIPSPKVKRASLIYVDTVLILFVVLSACGVLMRVNQFTGDTMSPLLFYAIMTLHGLGMAGTLFIGGFIAVWYLLNQYTTPNHKVLWFVYALVLIGTVGLVIATLIGKFGPGWYVLYPLPFLKTWPQWSIGMAIISIMLLGVAWLVGQLELLRAMAAKYGLGNLLGWQYFTKGNFTKIPPLVLITTVSLIAGIIATLSGATLLTLYLFQWFVPSLHFDPLLLKNAVFLFGHTLVNITMYMGIAVVYELMPSFSKRPWKTNTAVVMAWNASLILVLFAFFHHLYMDFVQPIAFQYIGQIASYISVVPATVVTIFGALAQVYRSGIKWSFVPLSFFIGLMGWVVGGLAALVDSTIAVNMHFHNTLWVPAHFHTYFLLGFVFLLFGFIYYLKGSRSEQLAKYALWIMMLGGYGFVAMFYIAGYLGVPRRFASYSAIPIHSISEAGQVTALIATVFASILMVGILMYFGTIWRKRKDADTEPLSLRM